jgi:hypothetical protein
MRIMYDGPFSRFLLAKEDKAPRKHEEKEIKPYKVRKGRRGENLNDIQRYLGIVVPLAVGDQVLFHTETAWQGPFQVVQLLGDGMYKLADCTGQILPTVVDGNRLQSTSSENKEPKE